MRFRDDFTGRKFGRLIALEFNPIKNRNAWNCVCECGGVATVLGRNLITGATRSCGCLNQEIRKRTVHGHSRNGASVRCHNCEMRRSIL